MRLHREEPHACMHAAFVADKRNTRDAYTRGEEHTARLHAG